MHTHSNRPLIMGGAAVAGAIALALSGAVAANAHVSIDEGTVEAGAYEIVTFSIPHGCGDSPTTEVAIQIPAGINTVTPTRNGFYTVEKVMEDLTTPITDAHGNQITERVAQVVYTAQTPLPADQRDAFELSLQIPEDAAGQTLFFPTVQTCEQSETAWVQLPEEGGDPHELDAPAPSVTVVAASDEHAGPDGAAAGQSDAAPAHTAADQTPLVITALVVGALGLLAGLIALFRRPGKA